MSSSALPSKQVTLSSGQNLNYIEVGSGGRTVLLLPGALCTAAGDMWPLLAEEGGLNKGGEFKLIAWDPPGYGKSTPPKRTWPLDFFERDADYAMEMMKILGKRIE